MLASQRVRAGNDDSILVGTEAAQMAGAITAIVSDGAAVYYNPSGLANTKAASLDASLSTYGVRFIAVKDLLEGPQNSVGAKYTDWVVVPSLVSHVLKLSERWRFSYAVIVPRVQNYSVEVTLRAPDETRWQALQQEQSQEIDIGAGVGGYVLDNLRFGASLLGIYNTDNLISSAFAGNPMYPNMAVSALSLVSTHDYGLSVRTGLQWDALPQLAFGVMVVSPNLVVVRNTTDNGSVFTPGNAAGVPPVQNFDRSSDTSAAFDLSGVPQVRMGGAYHYGPGSVTLDSTLNFPLNNLTYEGDRKFSWNLRAGMRHRLTDTVSIGSGLFTDRNPYRKHGADFYGFTLGASFAKVFDLSKGGSLSVLTSLNVRYAYGYGTATGSKVPALENAVGGLSFDAVSTGVRINELGVSLGAGLKY
ncbi:MAG: hypothetical protein QM778_22740 [Myxococcales bacterium]